MIKKVIQFCFLCSCVFSLEDNQDLKKLLTNVSIGSSDNISSIQKPPKKSATSKSNEGFIVLSGDVNVSKIFFSAKDNGVKLPRNTTSGNAVQTLVWELEVNVYLRYFYQRTFAEANLRFDNDMGTMGGQAGTIELHRMFMGYHLLDYSKTYLDLIVGREVISDLFESKLQYYNLTTIDGAYLVFNHAFSSFIDVEFKGAGIVYNFKDHHYAYIAELSINPVEKKGPYFKYSFTHWRKKGFTDIYDLGGNAVDVNGVPYGRVKDNPRYRFEISQWILGYMLHLKTTPIKLYGAFLWNHAAEKNAIFGFKKKNKAWYVGSKIGQMGEKNSYSFECMYQNVEAQSVADWDMSGITAGNPRWNVIYGPVFDDFTGKQVPVTQKNANGNVNYKGFKINFQYAIDKNIHLELTYDQTVNEDKSIGPFRRYRNLQAVLHYFF